MSAKEKMQHFAHSANNGYFSNTFHKNISRFYICYKFCFFLLYVNISYICIFCIFVYFVEFDWIDSLFTFRLKIFENISAAIETGYISNLATDRKKL